MDGICFCDDVFDEIGCGFCIGLFSGVFLGDVVECFFGVKCFFFGWIVIWIVGFGGDKYWWGLFVNSCCKGDFK